MVSLTLREVSRLVQCYMDDLDARCFLPSMVVIASTSQALRVFSFQDRPQTSITGSTHRRGPEVRAYIVVDGRLLVLMRSIRSHLPTSVC